jgi:hypothetical protein
MLKHGRSLEVVHQQISFQGQDLSFCSRITARVDLVIELDLADVRLSASSTRSHRSRPLLKGTLP